MKESNWNLYDMYYGARHQKSWPTLVAPPVSLTGGCLKIHLEVVAQATQLRILGHLAPYSP